jgi:hypothetical protein
MGRTALAFPALVLPALVLPALAACALAACFEVPVLPARDAAGRDAPRRFEPTVPTLLGVEALDVAGRAWPLDALPRSLVLRIGASVPLAASEEDVLIVRGSADSALRDDLARRPLTEATRARRIAADVGVDGSRLVLRPREPLEPGARITVAVAAFAASVEGESLAEAWLVEGVVSSAPDAGARAVAAFPADGTPDVPTNAEPFVLAFDGEIVPGEGAVILRASDRPIEHALGLVRCAPLGFEAPGCLVVAPLSALPEGQSLTLETTAALRDATGASVPRSTISMVTALATDVRPPAWLAPSACPLDATQEGGIGCVVATDRTWSIALETDEPVRFELATRGGVIRALAPRGAASLSVAGLPSSHREDGVLTAIDLAGLRAERTLVVATTPPLASLTITEVCADPSGPEPAQEWVEIANVGEAPVGLAGLTISDRETLAGAALASSRMLAPGARVLVVGDGFDADLAGAPPGAPLVVVGRTIVSGGLSNGGEALFLRDADGHRLAHVPALAGASGRCVVRREGGDPRADAITEFHYDACTPGR